MSQTLMSLKGCCTYYHSESHHLDAVEAAMGNHDDAAHQYKHKCSDASENLPILLISGVNTLAISCFSAVKLLLIN